jgi:hypothetical protein
VHQVGHYPELHQDARSTKNKIRCISWTGDFRSAMLTAYEVKHCRFVPLLASFSLISSSVPLPPISAHMALGETNLPFPKQKRCLISDFPLFCFPGEVAVDFSEEDDLPY